MADLHAALKTLSPTDWSDVPLDDLPAYMQDCFTSGELICNSVPPPPNGEPFHTAKAHHHLPNAARSAAEMHCSSVRPFPPHPAHEDLQTSWGKPVVKIGGDKNPLGVALYKMAGKDRHGAWFARRSVHEGLGFDKFKRAMMREFPQSLTVQGGPGAGAVRGLAADRRLERQHVEGSGEMEVYELSAQFPGPVTPRDFTPLLLTTETGGLTAKSCLDGDGGEKNVPRHYMIVSKPVTHPDAPERSGFVRGHYESVELIREIPLHHRTNVQSMPNLPDSQTQSEEHHHGRNRGVTIADGETKGRQSSDGEGAEERELNPVEWIMITRSDPGGGIPRFLVDRGTPDAMLGDVTKFLNWACSLDETPEKDDDLEKQEQASSSNAETQRSADAPSPAGLRNGVDGTSATTEEPVPRAASAPVSSQQQQQQNGMFSGISTTLEAGVSAYAPTAVSNQLHNYLHPTHAPIGAADEMEGSDTSSDDSSSAGSFMSAAEMRRMSTAPEEPREPADSAENLSLRSAASSSLELGAAGTGKDGKRQLTSHEKEVQKLMREREKLDRKLAKKRADEENKLRKSQEKESTDVSKAQDKHSKELQKAEEKHRKEIEKLEHKKAKEARKAEDQRRKKDERNKLSLVSRERDEFRSQMDSYKRENSLLLERVEELQRENTVMANKLGKLGPEVLKGVQEEVEAMARKRAVSRGSQDSKRSGDVGGS